ncbi:hypothetical protein G7Y89_g5084 [Cudoniella acicularis]|uniref:Uncharacterized protein n=1 Tax=Cudoniella acicularis TaxID=354080 RepID=A0A8H4RQC8_9HELO|nr:hypothetical protein G7Y89_g5084 [Cudoniella acicularis]
MKFSAAQTLFLLGPIVVNAGPLRAIRSPLVSSSTADVVETQAEYDQETTNLMSEGSCRAYLSTKMDLSLCVPKCRAAPPDNSSTAVLSSTSCVWTSNGMDADVFTDPTMNQYHIGECECNIPLLDTVMGDVVMSLPAIGEIACSVLFNSFDKIIEVGLLVLPGEGEVIDASLEAGINAAKTILENGQRASEFAQWFNPCGPKVPGAHDYGADITNIFNNYTSIPDTRVKGNGCKKACPAVAKPETEPDTKKPDPVKASVPVKASIPVKATDPVKVTDPIKTDPVKATEKPTKPITTIRESSVHPTTAPTKSASEEPAKSATRTKTTVQSSAAITVAAATSSGDDSGSAATTAAVASSVDDSAATTAVAASSANPTSIAAATSSLDDSSSAAATSIAAATSLVPAVSSGAATSLAIDATSSADESSAAATTIAAATSSVDNSSSAAATSIAAATSSSDDSSSPTTNAAATGSVDDSSLAAATSVAAATSSVPDLSSAAPTTLATSTISATSSTTSPATTAAPTNAEILGCKLTDFACLKSVLSTMSL